MRQPLTIIAALAASGLFTPVLTADTFTVCASDCDYTSIQAAIDAAANGDVIFLTDEVYEEGAEIDMRGKAITLKGQHLAPNIAYTKIKGDHSHRLIACRSGETSATVLQDLKFTGGLGEGDGGGGLLIEGSSPTINNCVFQNNKIDALMYGGGVLVSGGAPHFISPSFESNGPLVGGQTLLITGGGMAILDGNVTIEGPYVTANHAHIGGGLWVGSDATAHISVFNSTDGGTRMVQIFDNMAYGMDTKVYSGQGAGGAIANFGNLTIDGTAPPEKLGGDIGGAIYGNTASASDEVGGQGGGIYQAGTSLIVKNTNFTTNGATVTPFNVNGSGGAIYAATSIDTLVKVICDRNFPNGIGGPQGHGVGLRGQPPVVALDSCTIHGNGDDETDQQINGVLVMHLGDNHISKHAPPSGCPSDLNGDGLVDAADLGLLIAAWGLCP